jgi:anti-anti-sigma factor
MTTPAPSSHASNLYSGRTTIVKLSNKDLADQIAGQPRGRRDGHMMLDFTHVRQLGASGLTALLALGSRLRAGCGRLSLFNLNNHVHNVFTVAGLDSLFAPRRQEKREERRRPRTVQKKD